MLVTLEKEEALCYTTVWAGGELLPPRDTLPNQMWLSPTKVHNTPAVVFDTDVDDGSDSNNDSPLSGAVEA